MPETVKKRELLPDIINHQASVREKLARLRIQLDAFDSKWTASKVLLDGKAEKSDAESISAVDEIYLEMNRIENGLEASIKHLTVIRGNYLGPSSASP